MAILIERKRRRRRRKETLMLPRCNLNETTTSSINLNQDECLKDQQHQSNTCYLIPNMCSTTTKTDQDSRQEIMRSKLIRRPQYGQQYVNAKYNNNNLKHPQLLKQHCKVRQMSLLDTKSFSLVNSAISVTQLKRRSRPSSSSLLLLILVAFITATTLSLSTHLNLIRLASATSSSNTGSSSSSTASGGAALIINNTPPNQSLGNSVIPSAPATSITTTNGKARYKTMYACEDRQLVMDCDYGSKINLIRANYGRFSITQCNEQGQLDLSTDCMSPITFRIMRERCQDKQKCSVNATNLIFGDKCPKTRKYLEVHFQCQPDLRISTAPPSNMETERIDLRNIPPSSVGSSQHSFVYPAGTVPSGGSSSILPPNNPSMNPYHQPTQPGIYSQTRPILGPTDFEQTVQQRPGFQPTQPPFQPHHNVINSEVLDYSSIANFKPSYDPNNNSAEATSRLSEPIIVTLRHNYTENMHNPRCVLWDQSTGHWTDKGSRIINTNMTHTVCAFDQIASYMLVMDYVPSPPTFTVSIYQISAPSA